MSFFNRLFFSLGTLMFLLVSGAATAHEQVSGNVLLAHIRPQLLELAQNLGFLRGRPLTLDYVKKLVLSDRKVVKIVEEWYDSGLPVVDKAFREMAIIETNTLELIDYSQQRRRVDKTFFKLLAKTDRSFRNLYSTTLIYLGSEFNGYLGGNENPRFDWTDSSRDAKEYNGELTIEKQAFLRSLKRSQLHLRALLNLFHTLQNDTEYRTVKDPRRPYCFGCTNYKNVLSFEPGITVESPDDLSYYENDDNSETGYRVVNLTPSGQRPDLRKHSDKYEIYDINYWANFFQNQGVTIPGSRQARQELPREEEVVVERRNGRSAPPLPPSSRRPVIEEEDGDRRIPPNATRVPRAILEDLEQDNFTRAPQPRGTQSRERVIEEDEIDPRGSIPSGNAGRASGGTVLDPDPFN